MAYKIDTRFRWMACKPAAFLAPFSLSVLLFLSLFLKVTGQEPLKSTASSHARATIIPAGQMVEFGQAESEIERVSPSDSRQVSDTLKLAEGLKIVTLNCE